MGQDAMTREAVLQQMGLPRHFCPVPFSSLIFEADGTVGCCRTKGCEHPVGNALTQNFEEIWNGPRIREWRRDFLSGTNKICSEEIRHRGCHLRVAPIEQLKRIDAAEIQTRLPSRLGLNLNGQCNMSCPMCAVRTKPSGLYRGPLRQEIIDTLLVNAQEIEMLSGEPFIQKDTHQMMDVISRVNPTCTWNITTNAHWKLTDALKVRLDELNFRQLTVSLDSLVPEVYAGIRRGGSLSRALSTIQALKEYNSERLLKGRGNLNIALNCTIQKDNWTEIPDLLGFCDEHGFGVGIAFLYRPQEFSLLSEPLARREEILEHYACTFSADQLSRSWRVIRPLLESVSPLVRASTWSVVEKRTGTFLEKEFLQHLYFHDAHTFISRTHWSFKKRAVDLQMAGQIEPKNHDTGYGFVTFDGKPAFVLPSFSKEWQETFLKLIEGFDPKSLGLSIAVTLPLLLDFRSFCDFLLKCPFQCHFSSASLTGEAPLLSPLILDRETITRLISDARRITASRADSRLEPLESFFRFLESSPVLAESDQDWASRTYHLIQCAQQDDSARPSPSSTAWILGKAELRHWLLQVFSSTPAAPQMKFHLDHITSEMVVLDGREKRAAKVISEAPTRASSGQPAFVAFTHEFRKLDDPLEYLERLHVLLAPGSRISVIDAALTPFNRLLNFRQQGHTLATVWKIIEKDPTSFQTRFPRFRVVENKFIAIDSQHFFKKRGFLSRFAGPVLGQLSRIWPSFFSIHRQIVLEARGVQQ